MEQNFTGRFLTIAFVVLLGAWGIFYHGLKPGIDISGGTSLIYEIKTPPGQELSEDLVQSVAAALKKRVDPDGVRNLVWRPQGANRIEIQMPLGKGSTESAQQRAQFLEAQAQLERTNIRVSDVRAALAVTDAAQRQQKLDGLAMGSEKRATLFKELDEAQKKLAEYEKADDTVNKVRQTKAIREIEQKIEATNVAVGRLQDNLDFAYSAWKKAERDSKQPEIDKRKAEYEERLAAVRAAADFPARKDAVDNFVNRFKAFAEVKGSVDDAEDLKRLLRGSGVLEFYILLTPERDAAVYQPMLQRLMTEGPAARPTDTAKWVELDREDSTTIGTVPYGGKTWALVSTTAQESMTHRPGAAAWGLQSAYRTFDPRTNEAQVGFAFNVEGGRRFGELSGNNIGRPLAIVLDDRLISAPNLNSRIEDSGVITGSFSEKEINYLVRTLNAGSLPARLTDEPISERTISPSLGADNLRRGFVSSIVGLIVIAVFLIGYYYFAGVVAMVAVLINLIVMLGAMAYMGATFTLPGIAAFVLAVGMAVDANVLIFERLREEQHRGLSLRMALRNAYDRALSAIVDSNVTTAITSAALYMFGSEEIKGFGLTLLLGMLTSLFTALFVTRTIFEYLLEKEYIRKLGSLPLTFPNWDAALRPNINWMGKALVFYAFSAVLVLAGLSAFLVKGRDMFDIEFVQGTAVQVELNKDMDVEQMRQKLAPFDNKGQLPSARAVSIGNSKRDYEIITPNEDAPKVREAVMAALKGDLNIDVPSAFANSTLPLDQLPAGATVLPVQSELERAGNPVPGLPFAPQSWSTHDGGVAIVLKDLNPPLSAKEIANRIDRARLRDDLPYRKMNVETGTAPETPASSAVVLISDAEVRYDETSTDKMDAWKANLANVSWDLVRGAVSEPPALQKVTNFNPQVADQTKWDAIFALTIATGLIMIYIWIRFGDFKYASASVVGLAHDTLFTLGAVGLAHYVANTFVGNALLIDPFRIDLTMIAAILTVMGYSLNDKVVVFDRIRENRGKFGHVDRQVINDSINQTLSRTLLTGGTTIITILVMYVWGGPGIHGFTFALLVGIVVGTYSSIAIASPILLLGGKEKAAEGRPTVGQLQRAGG